MIMDETEKNELRIQPRKGDKLCLWEWSYNDHKVDYIEVLYAANGKVYFEHPQLDEEFFPDDLDWRYYQEPVTNDLKGMVKWYTIISLEGNIEEVLFEGWKPSNVVSVDQSLQTVNSTDYLISHIPESEAIKRGLYI